MIYYSIHNKKTDGTVTFNGVKKILVAEDDNNIAVQLKYHLEKNGYSIIAVVPRGEEVMQQLATNCPDLILLDIQLAGRMNGLDVADTILSKYDIPIIYLTSQTDKATLDRAKSTLSFGYLIKPVNPTELYFSIEMAVYQHQLARALQYNLNWLMTTLNSVGEGVISTNCAEEITFINPFAERQLGISQSDVLGQHLEKLFKLNGNDTDKVIPHPVQLAINEGQSLNFDNCQIFSKSNGSKLPVDCTISPLIDSKNNIIGGIFIFRDISTRLKAEADRQYLENQLCHACKMEVIGQLAGGISHEFSNIITGISSYVELILSMLPDDDPLRKYHTTILKKLGQATHLTRKLLTFSRKNDSTIIKTDLNHIINELSIFLRQTISNAIDIIVSTDEKVISVETDIYAIEQIITNLCLNARDALPKGGTIKITTNLVNSDCKTVKSPPTLPAGEYINISVKDNGKGMTEDIRQFIFEPFYTTKEAESGTGLGLSVVYGLVKQLGGWIFCTSEPDIGTEFNLYFPATPS